MNRWDRYRLIGNEIKLDKYNMLLVLMLEIVLFTNILIVVLVCMDIDTVFNKYCQKYMPIAYEMTVYDANQSHISQLKEDGFSEMEILYDDNENRYFSYAIADSLVHLDYKILKWKRRGVTIKPYVEDVINLAFFMKAILISISVLGIFLCILGVGNFYKMKIEKRMNFIKMLVRIGMPSGEILKLYRMPFVMITTVATLVAYLASFPIMNSLNRIIKSRFTELSIGAEKREFVVLLIFMVATSCIYLSIRNRWKKEKNS